MVLIVKSCDRFLKQGRMHDNSCRGQLGRGSNDLGRGSNDLGRGMLKYKLSTPNMPKNTKKAKCDRPTDAPTNRLTDTVTYRSRARDKNGVWTWHLDKRLKPISMPTLI